VITTDLKKQLNTINRYAYKGKYHSFSEDNIEKAVRDIDIPLTDGLIQTNEKIYDLLILGKSYEEFTPDGNRRSFNMNYIDWEHPENNVYHVTDEFQVDVKMDGITFILTSFFSLTAFPSVSLKINGLLFM